MSTKSYPVRLGSRLKLINFAKPDRVRNMEQVNLGGGGRDQRGVWIGVERIHHVR